MQTTSWDWGCASYGPMVGKFVCSHICIFFVPIFMYMCQQQHQPGQHRLLLTQQHDWTSENVVAGQPAAVAPTTCGATPFCASHARVVPCCIFLSPVGDSLDESTEMDEAGPCLRPPVTLYPNSIAFACLIEGRLKEL